MPEPARSGELEELQHLLGIGDPARLAELLPEAIRAAKFRALREALEPVIERSFSRSARRNPKELADTIFPVIVPAIRTSISTALRDFAEVLNQIVEKSFSLRGIRWRIESILTRKPYGEILLARSLLYSVEQVFLIHRRSGLLLRHAAKEGSVMKDADMVAGMLTAMADFVSDSLSDGGQDLETLGTGHYKFWLTYSPEVILVGAVSGTAPANLKQVFLDALDRIQQSFHSEIHAFAQGDTSVFEPAQPYLESCLLGQSPDRRKQARLWPWIAAVTAILLALLGWRLYTQAQWESYFEALKQQPGIVVTGIQKSSSSWVVSGLRDPLAPDPVALLRSRDLDPGRIRYSLQPYLSVNTPFASERERQAFIDRIERDIVRFDSNSPKIPVWEADRIDDLTDAIRSLADVAPGIRIGVNGHSDESTNQAINEKLSLDRANQVMDALVAQGTKREALMPKGWGNSQPLLSGNRSVTFRLFSPDTVFQETARN